MACADTRSDSEGGVARVTVRDSAGIEIHEHPAGSIAAAREWSLGPALLRVGAEGDDDESIVGVVGDATLFDDGSVAVADDLSDRVLLYDPDGAYLRTLVRRGEGPGELRGARKLTASGDSLIILGRSSASGNARLKLMRMTLDGRLVDERPVASPLPGPIRRTSLGALGVRFGRLDVAAPLLSETDFPGGVDFFQADEGLLGMEAIERVWRMDPDTLVLVDSLALQPVGFVRNPPEESGNLQPGWPLAMVLPRALAPTVQVGHLRAGPVIGLADRFELRFMDARGYLQRIIRLGSNPPRRSDYPSEDLVDGYLADQIPQHRHLHRRLLSLVAAPDTLPHFVDLRGSMEGESVWLRLDAVPPTGSSERVVRWLELSSTGEALRGVRLPVDWYVLEFRGDRVLAVSRDELDVETVVVHAIVPPGQGEVDGELDFAPTQVPASIDSPREAHPLTLIEESRFLVDSGPDRRWAESVALAEDGTAYVILGGRPRVYVFGSDGVRLDSPTDELAPPLALPTRVFLRGDTVVVYDAGALRLVALDRSGALLRDVDLGALGFSPGAAIELAGALGWTAEYRSGPTVLLHVFGRDTTRVYRVGGLLGSGMAPGAGAIPVTDSDPVLEYPYLRHVGVGSEIDIREVVPLLDPRPTHAADGRGFFYLSDGDRYPITILDSLGARVRELSRETLARPVTDELTERYVRHALAGLQGEKQEPWREAVRQRAGLLDRRTLPAIGDLRVSTEGLVWVERLDLVDDPLRHELPEVVDPQASWWDVFDPDGGFLGTVEVPPSVAVGTVGPDWMVGQEVRPDAVSLVRYRISFPD